jgi:hypothetical protein
LVVDKRAAIDDGRASGTCPECGKPLDTAAVGSGSLSDGVFCSLACLARFHEEYIRERIEQGTYSAN